MDIAADGADESLLAAAFFRHGDFDGIHRPFLHVDGITGGKTTADGTGVVAVHDVALVDACHTADIAFAANVRIDHTHILYISNISSLSRARRIA